MHSMQCYFSGTDMGELHDNAPNHDLYLSLIVNYDVEVSEKWCAKICYITKEIKSGTRKVKNNISFSRFLNGNNNPWFTQQDDSESEEPVSEEVKCLNMIDLVLEEEVNQYGELLTRIGEVKPKFTATSSFGNSVYNAYGQFSGIGYNTGYNKLPKNGYQPKSQVKKSKTKKSKIATLFDDMQEVLTPSIKFSRDNVGKFIYSIFMQLPSFKHTKKLEGLSDFEEVIFYPYHVTQLENYLSEHFELDIFTEFNLSIGDVRDETYLHLLGAQIMDIIEHVIEYKGIVDTFEKHVEPFLDFDLVGPVQTGMLLAED